MAETMDAGLSLLDRQVVDADGRSLGKVDDLHFSSPGGGAPPELVAIMIGQQAYGRRLGGRLGRWWTALAARISARPEAVAVPMQVVERVGVTVRLRVGAAAIPELERGERWLRERFIGRIPGAGRASG